MERFLLYWDDLDDLVGIVALLGERLRRLFVALLTMLAIGAAAVGGVLLAFEQPPLSMAIVTLLIVVLMNLSLTSATAPRKVEI